MNMQLPSRSYYYLEELAEAWGVQVRDLLDFALCDALQCSVLVQNIRVIIRREGEGEQEHCLSGLEPIVPTDLIEVIKGGVPAIRRFRRGGESVVEFAEDQASMDLELDHVLVTRADRTSFEDAAKGQASQPPTTPSTFRHRLNYSQVIFAGRNYNFAPLQAGVVRKLHEAFLAGQPWCHKGELTKEGRGQRIVDLFKRKTDPHWRDLIVYDGKGNWRLNLDDAERLNTNRAYRHVIRRFRKLNVRFALVPPQSTP